MFYLNVSGSANQYSHTPLKHIRCLTGQSLEEMQQHLPYFAECLHPSSGYSCIHTVIMEVNDDTGDLTIHHNHMGKNPLKVRKEINRLQEKAVKKAMFINPEDIVSMFEQEANVDL